MYLRRYCRDDEMGIFRQHLRKLLLNIVRGLKGKQQDESTIERVLEICAFVVGECEVGMGLEEVGVVCEGVMGMYV